MENQADNHPPEGPRPRKRNKRKSRNGGRRGGDQRSPAGQAASRALEDTAFDLRARGFTFAQIADSTGKHEDTCRSAYKRKRASLSVRTIEDGRVHDLHILEEEISFKTTLLRQMRGLLNDPATARLFSVRDYERTWKGVLGCLIRRAEMMGYDAPPHRLEWIGEKVGADLLTDQQLDNLNDGELRALYNLLQKARTGERGPVDITPTKSPPPTSDAVQ